MKIFLVRHAESLWNKQQRIQGRRDPGLSAEGKRQARLLAKRLKREQICVIYTSGLKRCAETAQIIAKETRAKIKFHPSLKEIILGEWEGRTVEEVMGKYPKAYSDWLEAPSKAKIPRWEGIAKFSRRVNNAFKEILNNDSDGSICVVTHWGVIAAYLSKGLGTDFDTFFKTTRIDNCGVSKIRNENNRLFIEYINDTNHLSRRRR